MRRPSEQPSVFGYDNYRDFLRDSFAYHRDREAGFTYRHFSGRAGLTSPSALKEVIDGKIGISRSSLPKYVKGFGLNGKEAEFFALLVGFCQAKSEDEQNGYYMRMLDVRRRSHASSLTAAQFEYCSKWYYSVIREMVGMAGFRDDPEWIAAAIRPAITVGQAKKALRLLKELGLVREGEHGLEQAAAHIDIDPDVNRLATRNLNRSMIARAGDAIEHIEPAEREISHVTIGLSRAAYGKLQLKIRKFKADVLVALAEDAAPKDMVCQMNIQLFPFAEEKNSDDSGSV